MGIGLFVCEDPTNHRLLLEESVPRQCCSRPAWQAGVSLALPGLWAEVILALTRPAAERESDTGETCAAGAGADCGAGGCTGAGCVTAGFGGATAIGVGATIGAEAALKVGVIESGPADGETGLVARTIFTRAGAGFLRDHW